MRKKLAIFIGLLLFCSTLALQAFGGINDNKALANTGTDKMCVPAYTSTGGDHWETNAFTFNVINRKTIQVIYKETGNCSSPSGLSSQFIHISGKQDFSSLANQNLILKHNATSDSSDSSTDRYEIETSGGDAYDESRIENLNFGVVSDFFDGWGMYKNHQSGTWTNILRNGEYTFSAEEDLLSPSGVDCSDGRNMNATLVNLDSDNKGVVWHCTDNAHDGTGASIYNHIQNANNLNIVYTSSSDGTSIKSIFTDDGNYNFTYCAPVKKFITNRCNGDHYLKDGNKFVTPDDIKKIGKDTKLLQVVGGSDSIDVVVAGPGSQSSSSQQQQAAAAAASAKSTISCDVSPNPLTWFLCPLVGAANEAANQLDNAITNRMSINSTKIFDTKTNCDPTPNSATPCEAQAFYAVWNNFRIVAMALLVVIGLIMIISQALDIGPFDAYTVKKIMPRLLVAVIFISVSWYAMRFMVDMSNDLAIAVRATIQAPFKAFGNSNVTTASITAGTIMGAAAFIALGPLGLLSFAVTGFLAVFVAFTIITLREIVIMFTIVLAPLAIACYILPNTQKLWKLWWETFSRGLLMFPIIMGFIAIGRVFAAVASTTDNGLMGQIVMFVAYFGPYFALPLAFKLAGGAIGNLSGMVNDRSRGMFDRTKKYRQGQMAERGQKLKTGDLYSDRNVLTRGINRTSMGVGTGGLAGGFGLNKRGRANIERARIAKQAERMKEPGVQDALYNEDVRLALMSGSGRAAVNALRAKGKSQDEINKAIGMAQSIGFGASSQVMAFNAEAVNKSSNFQDDANSTANQKMVAMANSVAAASGLDAGGLLQTYMFNAKAQRMDLADKSLDNVLDKKFDTKLLQASTADTWKRVTSRNLEMLRTGSTDQKYKAGAQLLAMQESLAGTGEEQRDAFVALMSQNVDYSSGSPMENQLANISGIQGQTPDEVAKIFRTTSSTYSQGNPNVPGGPGAGGGATSDRRLKTNIRLLCTLPNGINLYSFNYIWDRQQTFVGVMAQEILLTRPEAVTRGKLGFYKVKYDVIGLKMQTLEEWNLANTDALREGYSV